MSRSVTRPLALVLVPLALGGSLAACGSDDGEATAPTGTTAGQLAAQDAPSSPDSQSASGHDHGASADGSEGVPAAADDGDASPTDAAFLRQMIPHHKLAVEMATLAARQAEHPQLRRLAVGIITGQSKEIAELNAIAKDDAVVPDDTGRSMEGDAKTLGLAMDEMGMSMGTEELTKSKPFDKAFLTEMLTHHRGAIAMAEAEAKRGKDAKLKRIATGIVRQQSNEIRSMENWQKTWF